MIQENLMVNAEIYEILNLMGNRYICKIPKDIYENISNNRNENYKVKFKSLDDLNKSTVSEKSIETIIYLWIKYLANSEEEVNGLKTILNENEENLRKKYNYNNLFKTNSHNQDSENKLENSQKDNEILVINSKESIILKFKNWIKNLLKM